MYCVLWPEVHSVGASPTAVNNYLYSFGGSFKGFLKGVYKGSIVGFYGVGALRISYTILRVPYDNYSICAPKPCSNY